MQAGHRRFDVAVGSAPLLDACAQHLLDVDTGGATEHDQVDQRVAAEAVCAVHRHAGRFADRKQAVDDTILAIGADRQRLPFTLVGMPPIM